MAEDSEKFYNFLQRYDLHRYHQKFVDMGVRKISHLKDVDDNDLELVGLSRPERSRLRKKLENNFSLAGRLRNSVLGKSGKFDGPSGEEKEKDTGQLQSPKGKQMEQLQGQLPAPTIISSKQIKMGRQIGQGAFGAVHEATCTNAHGSVAVAVKFLTTSQSDVAYQTFHKEVASMSCLNHPHIIKLYGIILDSPMALVEELAPLGDLHSHLLDYKIPFKFQLLHTYSCQLADALHYLENQRVIHRDLATRNILLVKEDFIKLSDFGMARVLGQHSSVYNLSNMNTRIPIAWTSLEALQRAQFSTASDVWSYGVTLWEIYSLGAIPWEGLSPVEIRDKLGVGERLGRPSLCPVEIYRLMEACWNAIPNKRPTFEYIHQTIQELSPKKVLAMKAHLVDGEDILSFKAGEFIYVIDRPKPGWMYGVKPTGEKGHFQDECITMEVDSLSKLKEMVQTGKAKANDLLISGPLYVVHGYHFGSDGKQWVSEEAPDGTEVIKLPKPPSTPGLGTSVAPKSPTRDTNSPSPPRGEGDRYFLATEPMPSPSSDQLHQHHSSDDIMPSASSQPVPQGYTQGSNKRFSPMGMDSVRVDKFSPPQAPQVGYATPPRKHSEGDNCECTTAGQKRQQQDCNGAVAANRSTPHLPTKEGYDQDYRDNTADTSPDDEKETEYMEVSSPKAKEEEGEEVGYLKMRPCILNTPNHQRPLPIEYGTFQHRRSDQFVIGEIQIPQSLTVDSQERGDLIGSRAGIGSTERIGPYLPPSGGAQASSGSTERIGAYLPTSGGTQANSDSSPAARQGQRFPLTPPPIPIRASPTGFLMDSPIVTASGGVLPQPLLHSAVKESPAVPPRTTKSTKGQPPVPLPRKNTSVPSLEQQVVPSPGPTARPSYVINLGHRDMPLVDVLQLECPDVDPFTCKRVLEAHNYNIAEAKEHLQIEQLMSMGIPNTTMHDCRRALEHCQHSVDRAAGWLLDNIAGIK